MHPGLGPRVGLPAVCFEKIVWEKKYPRAFPYPLAVCERRAGPLHTPNVIHRLKLLLRVSCWRVGMAWYRLAEADVEVSLAHVAVPCVCEPYSIHA